MVNFDYTTSALQFSDEMIESLQQPEPERFFRILADNDIGLVFLPELVKMKSIPAGPPKYHPEDDLLSHSLQVLHRVSLLTDNPLTRFCALFHDIGKLATNPANYPKHNDHDCAGMELADKLCLSLGLADSYRTALMWTSRLHMKASRWIDLRDSTKIMLAHQAHAAGITSILPIVVAADKQDDSCMAGWEDVVYVDQMEPEELGINFIRYLEMTAVEQHAYLLQKRAEKLRVIVSSKCR